MLSTAVDEIPPEVNAIWKQLLNPATPYGALLYAVVIGFIAWLVGRAIAVALKRMLKHPKYIPADRTAIGFLAQLVRLGVYLIAFVMYAQVVPVLHHLGAAWLASVGVVSVVLGLAAQNTLGNLIAGISLLLYRPFNLGDRLQVTAPSGVETGVVESLNLGYTVLRTGDNRRVVIPNSAMASQTSINLSLTDRRKFCVVPFRIRQDADVDKARQILVELAKQHPKALEYVGCPVTALGKSSVTLSLQVWCEDGDAADNLKGDLLESAKKRFEQEGIPIHNRPVGK
jgi:small conductance mechanosensitive channel